MFFVHFEDLGPGNRNVAFLDDILNVKCYEMVKNNKTFRKQQIEVDTSYS